MWKPVLTWHMPGKYASAELSHTPSLDFVFKKCCVLRFLKMCVPTEGREKCTFSWDKVFWTS